MNYRKAVVTAGASVAALLVMGAAAFLCFIATFDTVAESQASVTLSAKDGPEGSGVADTYYMLEGVAKSRLYTGVFTVPSGTFIRFLSVDRAGNVESIRRTKVKLGG